MSREESVSQDRETVEEQPIAEAVEEQVEESGETAAEAVEVEEDAEQMPVEELGKSLEEARGEAKENYDRFLRTAAELDNYRKRTARMRMETREEVLRDVLLQIAPVLDNLSRALGQEQQEEGEGFKQGVELIYNQLQDVLKGFGLEEIAAIGQAFDPNLHEALMEVESPEHASGTIVEQMEKGYTLNGKIVRPSRVIVSKSGG